MVRKEFPPAHPCWVDKDFNGQAILSSGYTVGFLEQEPLLDETKMVREIVEQGVQDLVDLHNEYNQINERFAEPMSDEDMNKLIERQGEVQGKLMRLAHGTWILVWKWRWTPCVAPKGTRR